ncbi:3-phosphoshikimate 1-carboxyvinyltransferase [Flavobacterium agricola]|uniref:3-phosphoshikimate 1-carboxyvinyltransferase n=1 Tax=Flavobacterium agricola TaxID=2870839 RepID=A0ABY6M0A6_9FLAO|nr:3-phosphoshikimate 1-carboxyvinyltransferase [Flavobacterium agricola]UYW00613.1 3-phosphoshikimate 1-carboxyvinyltransferase [Flavobacterium agricola]
MDIHLNAKQLKSDVKLVISGSKSESNRILLLQALYPYLKIHNLSNSDDSEFMQKALQSVSTIKDIHHAGTAMRFLTAFYATTAGQEVVMQGSSRMHERPIGVLVDALQQLGANITYLENQGYPPLKIVGKNITLNQVRIKADVSSQYISALLLVAPKLENGLEIELLGEVTSVPYLKMTLQILTDLGIENHFSGNKIIVKPCEKLTLQEFTVESDWSSASYFYSIVALQPIGFTTHLASYKKSSLQGDSVLQEIYKDFGVETIFSENQITLKKVAHPTKQSVAYDLRNAPDIAQTIAVTCLALGMGCNLTGLHTLKIKETDRLLVLENEISKFGASISTTSNTLLLAPFNVELFATNPEIAIKTYQDHRMAMAFAPLACKQPITILEAEVVTKSYLAFWDDLKRLNF